MNNKYKQDTKTGKFLSAGMPVMADKPITVRLPVEIDAAIREMSDRSDFLREVISLAVKERLSQNNKQKAGWSMYTTE